MIWGGGDSISLKAFHVILISAGVEKHRPRWLLDIAWCVIVQLPRSLSLVAVATCQASSLRSGGFTLPALGFKTVHQPVSHSVVFNSLRPHGVQYPMFLCFGDFPGKLSGVSCHFLLQVIFLTQGSNLHLLRLLLWQVDSLPPCHLGSCDN